MIDFKEIRGLFDVYDNSSGIAEEEIVECEISLGKRFPEVLRQYYLQFGNNEEINQTQDRLVLPSELEIYEDAFVDFYVENQGVWRAAIKLSDFALENPSVYLNIDKSKWELVNENLSDFLISIAYLQALFAFPFNANGHEFDSNKINFIQQNWEKVDYCLPIWKVTFYQNSFDEILALMGNANVFIAAKNSSHFEELHQQLNIDWDYNSLEDQ